jgi:hypothetical protein
MMISVISILLRKLATIARRQQMTEDENGLLFFMHSSLCTLVYAPWFMRNHLFLSKYMDLILVYALTLLFLVYALF